MKRATKSALFLTALLMGTACFAEVDGGDDERVGNNDMSFEEFMELVYQEPDSGVYIVDGDTPIASYEELVRFYETYVLDGALIVNTEGGEDDVWGATDKHNLTYCISQASFGAEYDRAKAAMVAATEAWEAVADVDFIHVESKDGSCDFRTKGVKFDVRQVQSGQYLARAFFPSTSRRQRNVLIDVSSYYYDDNKADPLSLTGILRHELGHALGFRHEHTRIPNGPCLEPSNWRPLTAYDSDSVMHYPQCDGTGDWSLVLTALDKQGAGDLYGQPGAGGAGGAGGTGGTGGTGGAGGEPQCTKGQPGDSCKKPTDCCSKVCAGKGNSKVCQ